MINLQMKFLKLSLILTILILVTTSCMGIKPESQLVEESNEHAINKPTIVDNNRAEDKKFLSQNYIAEDKYTRVFKNCFKTGRLEVQKSCKKRLRDFLKKTALRDKRVVIIEVHTDKGGSSKNNLLISKKRAYSAASSLYYKEYKYSKVYYRGFGESRPLYDTRSSEADYENRRLVVILKDKKAVIDKKRYKYFSYKKRAKIKASKRVTKSSTVKSKTVSKKAKKRGTPFSVNLIKYTGVADTGWIYFGKKELKKKFLLSCADDKPRKVKRKAISKFKKEDFITGLYSKKISGKYKDNSIEIFPIYINEKGYLPKSNPMLMLQDKSEKITRYQTTVNSYRGTKGILYRVFVNGKKKIKCMDVVISYETKEVSYAQVYTQENGVVERFKVTPTF